MKQSVLFMLIAFLIVGISFQSCDKDDPIEEFVADDNTFSDFMNWELEAQNQGPDPFLGPAHAGNDQTVLRKIYYKDGQNPTNGEYPIGTVIVKHSSNSNLSINEFTAMVKRGNDFNSDAGDWEWFMLNADGKIATDQATGMKMRGANLMNGMCIACHSAATTDFAFTK